ncbi:Hsp70 family protein [Micromonospora sp. HM5-17]|uniref:Hsp70 family protein n=1 Tax=Micromonospora sp. HM5-17 TaxID=2487710 RepID=UPI000F474960|nr:Hsp70 family protein [Micromonospora sp. HM5-17]ROT28088.1 Hsp70 family protein [Micromonospora sp. HM5-17]
MEGQDGGGYGLGVDLGTSHTVAVLRWPDGRTRPLLFDGQPILPSGVFLGPDGRLYVGRDAQRLAQADPARYEPNPKRRIDEPAVLLGDREIPTAELLASVLRAVANAAVEAVGFLPPAVLTYPATWGARRREALAAAVAQAGWPPVGGVAAGPVVDPDDAEPTVRLGSAPAAPAGPGSAPVVPAPRSAGGGTLLVPEPVAAARYFVDVLRRPVPVGSALAVFDFGGGTLDIAVVRNEGVDGNGRPRFAVIGSGGVPDLGGLDLDAALVQHLGTVISVAHGPVWQQLNQPVTASQWRNRRQFWDDVRGAKEMLSRAATAPVPVPGIEQALHLTREELERVITPLLRRGVFETATVIANCRLTADQLAGLFLVGGSSRVPLVARLLHAELGIAPTVLEQPELPVAEGALAELAPAVPAAGTEAPAGVAGVAPTTGVPVSPAGGLVSGAPAGAVPVSGAPAGGYEPGRAPVATAPHPVSPGQPGAPGSPPPYGAAGAPAYPNGPAGGGMPPTGGAARLAGWAELLRRRVVWLGAGAAVAVVAVAAAAVLYLTRDPYPALDFAPFAEVGRIATREPDATTLLTTTGGDRAYVGYQRSDNRLDVAVVDPTTAKVARWFTTDETAERWLWLQALPKALIVRGGATSSSDPGVLVGFDPDTGKKLWSRQISGGAEAHSYDEYVVLLDRDADAVIGINARTGREWSLPSPKGEFGSDSAVEPVHTPGEYGGTADAYGNHMLPNRGKEPGLVEVGADGSVRLIDVAAGKVLKERANAADTDDLLLAYEGELFVAPKSGGYGLARFDLRTLGTPTTVYTAPDKSRQPVDLLPCGEHQVCVLETAGTDSATAQLVAVRTDKAEVAWRRDVPKGERLRAVGQNIVVQTTSSGTTVRLFTPDGRKVLEREGVASRINGGNLLLFDDALSTYPGTMSVAGVVAKSGRLTQLGPLKEVVGTSCSWTTSVLICAGRSEFVLTRFVAE